MKICLQALVTQTSVCLRSRTTDDRLLSSVDLHVCGWSVFSTVLVRPAAGRESSGKQGTPTSWDRRSFSVACPPAVFAGASALFSRVSTDPRATEPVRGDYFGLSSA